MPALWSILAKVQNQHRMSLPKEQKKELIRLEHHYEQINLLSVSFGMNPDNFINEFSYKFMDVSELNRQQVAIRNEERHNVFRNEQQSKFRRSN